MKSPLVIDGEHDYLCFFPLGSLISLPPPEMIPEEVSISDSCSSVFSEFIFNATVEDMCHVTSRFSYGDQGDESLFEIRLLKKKKKEICLLALLLGSSKSKGLLRVPRNTLCASQCQDNPGSVYQTYMPHQT